MLNANASSTSLGCSGVIIAILTEAHGRGLFEARPAIRLICTRTQSKSFYTVDYDHHSCAFRHALKGGMISGQHRRVGRVATGPLENLAIAGNVSLSIIDDYFSLSRKVSFVEVDVRGNPCFGAHFNIAPPYRKRYHDRFLIPDDISSTFNGRSRSFRRAGFETTVE